MPEESKPGDWKPGERWPEDVANYEATPLTRQEYISAVVHLYRGELHRSTAWRQRLDHTTNLAVLTTAGLVAYSFNGENHQHWVLLAGINLVTFFHLIEARRFRFADVWRARVRMIEENFYGPILRRNPVGRRKDWGALVAEDLFRPRFKMTMAAAFRQRFVRNYWAIYLVTVVAWLVKVLLVPVPVTSFEGVRAKLGSSGILPWWVPVGIVCFFAVGAVLLAAFGPRVTTYDLDHWTFDGSADRDESSDA